MSGKVLIIKGADFSAIKIGTIPTPTPTTYTITNNLTNCVSSNSATSINANSAFSATITANSGYTLGSVTCTMGGVSQTVNNGVISIASVTGNIVITASATAVQPVSQNITFADANVKSILVNFVGADGSTVVDTNGDGEISYEEAAATTTLKIAGGSSAFRATNITSFDEFVNFSGMSSLQTQFFQNCTALTSVKLSNSVTTLNGSTFDGDIALTSVTLSNTLATIGASEFSGCTALTSVTLPNSLTTAGIKTFYNCSGLTSVNLGSGLTNLSAQMFENCTNLAITSLPDTVENIGEGTFRGCTKLALTSLPSSLTKITYAAFQNCKALAFDTIPASCSNIGGNCLYNSNIKKIKVMATTPPTIISTTFNGVTDVYVPDAVWSAYQADSNWSALGSKLKKISEWA